MNRAVSLGVEQVPVRVSVVRAQLINPGLQQTSHVCSQAVLTWYLCTVIK